MTYHIEAVDHKNRGPHFDVDAVVGRAGVALRPGGQQTERCGGQAGGGCARDQPRRGGAHSAAEARSEGTKHSIGD